MENTSTDVLWENEVNANKIIVAAALVTAGIYAIVWCLNIADIVYLYKLILSMIVAIIIEDHASPGKTPSEIIAEANAAICANNREQFDDLTMLCIEYKGKRA